MKTRQTSIRLSELTDRQIEALTTQGFGSFSDIIRIAIDRMHQQEVGVYEPFDPKRLYDGTNHGLPAGARVQLSDGKHGHVVAGNPDRSLVAYSADRITGCLEARDWFDNSTLRVRI
jgi:hypothetical protein